MLRIAVVSALLALALSMGDGQDFGGPDESRYESLLKDQGFTEKEIAALLQEDDTDRSEVEEEEEYFSWSEAKGYDDCRDPEFMWWRKKGSWKGSNNEVLRNRRHHGSHHGSYHKNRGNHGSHHGSYHKDRGNHGSYHKGKGKDCPKPKPLSQICDEYECPKIERLNISGCGFEARKVFAANWVVTDIDLSGSKEIGYQAAFWRLFKYIGGANDQGVKIDMTVPVINKWFMNDNYDLVGASMAFYITAEHQSSPPVPTDPSVRIESWEDAITYDRAFGGNRMDEAVYKREFELLWKALSKENITPYTQMAITAGYTRPGWGRQRHEVMYLDQDSV